ncbi:hypothetical protein SADUNF_Sadunf02G0183700 [Salix dunnii]|uniref:Uncharacterized protein n=1 Tax=Salix dunnii TaxID=1413687 RepID=A0A835THV3_9ROSI|nr:hypothetical protein SADUNF_Sadunf02G0183700 [Salix dunnii]
MNHMNGVIGFQTIAMKGLVIVDFVFSLASHGGIGNVGLHDGEIRAEAAVPKMKLLFLLTEEKFGLWDAMMEILVTIQQLQQTPAAALQLQAKPPQGTRHGVLKDNISAGRNLQAPVPDFAPNVDLDENGETHPVLASVTSCSPTKSNSAVPASSLTKAETVVLQLP